jgi:hypothetical protein
LTATIDRLFAAHWSAKKVEPAPQADDAEFLRRAYLDLAGRIPSVAETRAFLADPSSDKRRRLVERLLNGPRYVTHFTNVWRSLMLPEANASFQARFLAPGFEAWLRKQLAKNAGYDQMVRELLTTPVAPEGLQNIYNRGPGEPTPLGYFLAKELKPENLAAGTARLFLGVRVECAQCHDAKFHSWKRDQFWGLAAFFAGIQRQSQGDFVAPSREVPDKKEITIPGTDRTVQASYLDRSEPQFKYKVSPRVTLADWVTRADNPYFARAAANRMWYYFFGTGLIDPVDDMVGGETTASQPEVLDEMARALAAHRFDLKFLIRAITASRPYQLTSAQTHPSQADPRQFAHMAMRGLAPEQLFDSVAQATGYQEAQPLDPRVVFYNNSSPRAEFIAKFATKGDKANDPQTSILQALALMNGKLIADATTLERSETLAAVADAPFLDTAGRIEALCLATFSRKPKPKEMARLLRYVEEAGGRESERQAALADVFWALLNSGEFFLNH